MTLSRLVVLATAALLLALPFAARAAPPSPTAVFPFELLDTSGEGAKPGQQQRLALATRELADLLAQSGRYQPVDLAPFAAEIKATEPRYACGDCWLAVARKAGAKFAVIAVVHKVSTLISTMDIRIADLQSKQFVAAARGQIRGDTDTAYVRGVDFLVKDKLLATTP
jgi:Protein of unknown function (DUF2380)